MTTLLPRHPDEFNLKNLRRSFSPSPIPVEDSDSVMKEIDIFLDGDESIPPDRNKIYDPGICIEVESTRILSTLSSEKSPSSSSHRGFKASQPSPESPMLIHGDNTPNLGCPGFLKPLGYVLHSPRASHPQLYFGNPIS
ncbi:hypothetical protein Tco_0932237 [Tanacetum coccineum]